MTSPSKPERGIRQLPSGKFEYTIRYRGRLERRVFRTKTLCKAMREKRLVELREGHLQPVKAPSFEEAVKKFLAWSATSCRPSTQRNDRWVALLWLASPHLQHRRLDRITPGDVERFKQEQRARMPTPRSDESPPPTQPVGPRSVDVALARLRRLFSLCMDWGLVRENPARRVALLREDGGRIRYLAEEEEASLLGHCTPRLALLVRFAVLTGLRRSEILGLCPAEVDLSAGVAVLPGTRTKGRRTRAVPLNAEAVEILQEMGRHRDFRPAPGKELPPEEQIPFFANRRGKLDDRLYRSFLEAVRTAGLRDVTFHDLRHTYASRLVMAGVNMVTVQRLLGHSDLSTTQRYAHLAPGAEAEAVKVLSRSQSIGKSIGPVSGASQDRS